MTTHTQKYRSAPHGRFLLAALVSATISICTTRTVAQSSPPSEEQTIALPEFTVSTTSDKGYRAGNSVSATRVDTAIKDLPFAVSAFTSQFIADIGSRDLFEVVQYSGSVTSAGREFNGGNAVYNIRGFDQPPQKDGFTGQAYVDTASIERVEVVKGPASVLYGQVSPGGTVNYITKKPQPKAAYGFAEKIGSYKYARASADINQPILPGTLFFRVNAALENGTQYVNFTESHTSVVVPSLTWKIADRLSLTVDYSLFRRQETPPAQFLPNIEVVAAAPTAGASAGILPTAGVLVQNGNFYNPDGTRVAGQPLNQQDSGFLGYYPGVPGGLRKFNYGSKNDWRNSMYDSLNAELTAGLGNHWTARFNVNYSEQNNSQKLTGLGNVSVEVPTSYYTGPAYMTVPNLDTPNPTDTRSVATPGYIAGAYAFAQDILSDPSAALQAPRAQLGRRNRLQRTSQHGTALQGEFAGKYEFGSIKVKPLIGAFYQKQKNFNQVRQTGSAGAWGIYEGTPVAAIPTPLPWDFKNPDRATAGDNIFGVNFDTNFDPTQIPLTTFNYSTSYDKAVYGVINASFFDDRLSAIAGLRYSRAAGKTKNFLAASVAASEGGESEDSNKSPMLGLGFKLTRSWLLYASYSESFRRNAASLQVDSQPAGLAKPTTAKGYEVGMKTDFLDGRVSSTLSVYRIDQNDRVITFNSFSGTGTVLTNTVQDTMDRAQGIEAELTWSPFDNWQVFVSGSVNDIEVRDAPGAYADYIGTRPEATVKYLTSLWTRYNFSNFASLNGLWVGAGYNYTGKKAQRVNNPALNLDATLLWNAAVGYDWKLRRTELSATLNFDNITDELYFPANQQRGLPRRITLSLGQRF